MATNKQPGENLTFQANGARCDVDSLQGSFALGSRLLCGGTSMDVPLGSLAVCPAEEDPDARSGQWELRILREVPQVESFFIRVASRLGLLPVRLASGFAAAIKDSKPMALVADTNALRNGLLAQTLRAREGRAVHVAVADQAYMEVHRQRESAHDSRGSGSVAIPGAPNANLMEQWGRASDRCGHLTGARRALRRVRDEGYLVHVARPPDAKVRYLGGSAGAAQADGDEEGGAPEGSSVASNLVRDRLVLEAAFQQMAELPGVPTWLLTSDALLAEQADMEGLSVGFGWLADRLQPPILTSPVFDPLTLRLHHVPVGQLLEEIVWSSGVVTLHREGEGKRIVGSVPLDRKKKRWRALAALGEPRYDVIWKEEPFRDGAARSSPAGSAVGELAPKKAPPALALMNRLIAVFESRDAPPATTDSSTVDAYLRAAGWANAAGALTQRGGELAEAWMRLDDANVDGWVDWMYDAANDVRGIPALQGSLRHVQEKPGATDKVIAASTKHSERTVQAQLGLASAFGAAIRLGGKTWPAGVWEDDAAAEAVVDAIRRMVAKSPAGTASVARTFTSFLDSRPMSVPVFRRALLRIRARGWATFGGSSPENTGVRIRVLVRARPSRVETRNIDLGYGDFLLPGTPCAVATPVEVER
jgi:hypothetical protein